MHILAYGCLLGALLTSLGGGCLALLQLWQNRDELLKMVRGFQHLSSLFLLLASALLLHALFWQDYRLEYVASYTDSYLPVFYRLTAFWAGQAGSMLFWALAFTLCGSIFMCTRSCRQMDSRTALWFWMFFLTNTAFFCLVLTCWSNPFLILEPSPVDGNGLNPLLQNPGMIFHPPLLFMGYAAFGIPGCLAMAQLMSCPLHLSWPRLTRPFILGGWILLTAGIVLGAWWAYMELGWGGYWAWDPVENASLLPWLIATAAMHILAITNAGGKLGRVASFLMALTLLSAIFATYLTRSGVIQSVHAFGDGGVGTPLLLFVLGGLLIAFGISFTAPGRSAPLATPISREGALVLTSWIFLALALIILLATMWPVFSRMGANPSQGLEAAFYNRVCLPPAAFLLVLLCICTWLGWTGALAGKNAAIRLYATCGAFLAALGAIWIYGYRQPLALVSTAAAIAALCAMCMHIFTKGIWANKRALSALGAHGGLALLAIGIACSGPYKIDSELLMAAGQTEKVGPYEIRLEQVSDGDGPGYDYLQASLKVTLDGKTTGILKPQRRIYIKFGSMQFSEVDVISTLGEDIYASLLGMDEDYKVLVKISIEPLVNWIWIGGALMCLLPLLGFMGKTKSKAGQTV